LVLGFTVSKIISVLVFICLTHYSEEVDTRCVSWLVGYTVISWSHLILATAHPKPIVTIELQILVKLLTTIHLPSEADFAVLFCVLSPLSCYIVLQNSFQF